jgi:ATP-dependent helicase/nuclease subunit B
MKLAFERVRELVEEAQASSRLSQVTLIVPTRASGIDLRRYLARSAFDGSGVLNVATYTLAELATALFERAGAGAGRRAIFPEVWRGALHAELALDPGLFGAVWDQAATSRALARASELLDSVEIGDHDFGALVNDVVRLHTAASARIRSAWFTPRDEVELASTAMSELGTVITFALPDDLSPLDTMMLTALPSRVDVRFIADDNVLEDAVILTAPDADEECRAVAREVVRLIADGMDGNRIGVFWGSSSPYRVLLHRHLADAGVAVTGPGGRQLADTALTRSVLAMLELDGADLDPRAILDIIADGVVVWRGGTLPSSAHCERMFAREIVDEPADPTGARRIVAFVDSDAQDDDAPMPERESVFDTYLRALSATLNRVASADSWAAASDQLSDLVEEHFQSRDALLTDEYVAARSQLLGIVSSLRYLDGVASPPDLDAVRKSVRAAVEGLTSQTGVLGRGVSVGPLSAGVARDLDAVFIVGLAEGVSPSRQREDPLLPDSARALWHLPVLAERIELQHQQFRSVAAVSPEKLTLTFPRGDLRGAGDREPSRWLSTIADKARIDVASHHTAIALGDIPPTTEEGWRLRARLGDVTIPDIPFIGVSRQMRGDRRRGRFTRFNGDLSGVSHLIDAASETISATNLEDWVSSPYFYFIRHVLNVRPMNLREEGLEPDALDLGNITHRILELYTAAVLADAQTAANHDTLVQTARKVFAEAEKPGWLPHLWRRNQQHMLRQLDAWWLDTVATGAWHPISAEASFGPREDDTSASLPFELGDGSAIRFKGKIDRIDRSDGVVTVIDYKTGSQKKYEKLDADRPTADGHFFQLPVYGLYAQSLFGGDLIETRYDFLAEAQSLGYPLTEAAIDIFRTDVSLIVNAVRRGIFPPRPAAGAFSTFTSMAGASELADTWELLLAEPQLAEFSRLWIEEQE